MTQLFEAHDLALGGPKQFEAWYDCGTAGPVQVVVRQATRGRGDRILRWQGAAWSPGSKDPVLIALKSDLSVRDLPSDAGVDALLEAARADSALIAERADMVLGCLAKAQRAKK